MVSSAWYPGGVGMLESYSRRASDRTLGSVYLLRGWSTTGTGFIEM